MRRQFRLHLRRRDHRDDPRRHARRPRRRVSRRPTSSSIPPAARSASPSRSSASRTSPGRFASRRARFATTRRTPAASSIRWRVRVASVLTDASNRDRSLQAAGVLRRGPPSRSSSSRAAASAAKPDGALEVTGDLTMRGVTRADHDRRPRPSRPGGPASSKRTSRSNRYDFGIAGGTRHGPAHRQPRPRPRARGHAARAGGRNPLDQEAT